MRILLIDNGSRKPDATLNLRRVAAALAANIGRPVDPVSLLHANKIAPEHLDGTPAQVLEPFLDACLAQGERQFLVLPLFFGPSRALTEFIPEVGDRLAAKHGTFDLRVAEVLCPLPKGEPRLVRILRDQLAEVLDREALASARVILVDHGSPIPEVTAVRSWLAGELRGELGGDTPLFEAVMERRAGTEYDFNGPLLEAVLERLATERPGAPIVLSMLFLSPGRHAGSGGDIEQICETVRGQHPGLQIDATPLVAEHPGLVAILADRLAKASKSA